ncbi:CRTAC1 family protein [Solwaraspora sp. WMMD791]|uniref:CRTAC1 family protein n=1 Tax=Solwaraspora sp. WMMD791 TaxID=3016086 RepID=UPI00249BCE25|nr:CRTAC1 family protein [Solwaraspora sp. WMMD791]WFE29908.1 CRTAC1 family protein [Solwaraspora sp. WMMD791]
MSSTVGLLRRQLAGVIAVLLVVSLFVLARQPGYAADTRAGLAAGYSFTPMSIAMPGGFTQQSIRKVNQEYEHIDAWISSVGAAIAMNDLDGDGLANDLCVTDPRIDQVVVSPTPDSPARYAPFALDPDPLPMHFAMAPMGCAPGDFNADGRMDLLVYLWGRTPIIYLARADVDELGPDSYRPTELMPGPSGTGYTGPDWNTNTVTVADFDGDGYEDIHVGNYFPHSPVLDHTVYGGVEMNHSMSHGLNGGPDYIFRWTGATSGAEPTVRYERVDDAIPADASTGWALASGAIDLDGDLLPELYLAHDFGPDRLLHNRSTPGTIDFAIVEAVRKGTVPKSKQLGVDSFKGMGVDFGDLDGDGNYDLFVSNITTSFGIVESNYAFINDAADTEEMRRRLAAGEAPFTDRSAPMGLAWSGWGWDTKLADFNNSGQTVVTQALGFVKGEVNRWPQLQELATANDLLLSNPAWWPNVRAGDDVAGGQTLRFFVPDETGRYVDVAAELGLAVPVPTRGIATGDADGDGLLDWAVARQWAEPVYYHNDSPSPGAFLGLHLTHPHDTVPRQAGSPATGAQVVATTADGRVFLSRVDGGSGHSGHRSHEVHIGLGEVTGPVQVQISWRDRTGQAHEQTLEMTPGWHSVQLGSEATVR